MKILLLMIALLLAACDSSPSAPDGFTFEQTSERLEPPRQLVVVTVASQDDLNALYERTKNAEKLPSNAELFGFGVISSRTCTIYIVDPKLTYKPEHYGHELTHCLYGNWHPNQKAAT